MVHVQVVEELSDPSDDDDAVGAPIRVIRLPLNPQATIPLYTAEGELVHLAHRRDPESRGQRGQDGPVHQLALPATADAGQPPRDASSVGDGRGGLDQHLRGHTPPGSSLDDLSSFLSPIPSHTGNGTARDVNPVPAPRTQIHTVTFAKPRGTKLGFIFGGMSMACCV